MNEIVITKPGVLQIHKTEIPTPGKGEVRIKVKASGINFADILAKNGLYPDAPPLPLVVGYEVSGVVDQIGEGVTSNWRNKPVIAFTVFKGYAEYVVTPIDYCVEKPNSLSFIDAAAIPVCYSTAWMLMYVMGGLRKGDTVLIHNAGGGVGLACIDIASHIGAVSIGTASGWKHSFLKQRGLDHAIDHITEDISKRVMEITGSKGVDLCLDPVGGSSWNKNFALLRSTGRLGMYGASTLATTGFDIFSKLSNLASLLWNLPKWSPLTLMDQNKGVFGLNMVILLKLLKGHMWHEKESCLKVLKLCVDGTVGDNAWVKPHVCAVYSFSECEKAHELIVRRENIGKIILVPTEEEADANKEMGCRYK